MQTEDAKKIDEFKESFLKNLGKTFEKMQQGKWKILYDGENDEFMWVNSEKLSSESSLLFPIDDYLGISVSKDTAEIEYFVIQDFKSVFVKKNPEWKKFAMQVVNLNKVLANDDLKWQKALEELAGKLCCWSLPASSSCCA